MDRQKLEKLKRQSREDAAANVLQRGSVHFRLDPEMMSILVEEAKKVRVPFGVFARMLMIESLRTRASSREIPADKHPGPLAGRSTAKPAKRKLA